MTPDFPLSIPEAFDAPATPPAVDIIAALIGKLPLYTQVGTALLMIGTATVEQVLAAAKQAGQDKALLDWLYQEYERRLALARGTTAHAITPVDRDD